MYLLLLIAVYKPNCLSGTLKCYSALLLSKWCVCVIISCSTWCCWASIFCTQSSFGNASGCSHCGTFWFSNIRVCCHANCGTPSSTRKALCCFCNTFMCMWTVTTQFGMMRNFLVTKHLKVKKKNVMKRRWYCEQREHHASQWQSQDHLDCGRDIHTAANITWEINNTAKLCQHSNSRVTISHRGLCS